MVPNMATPAQKPQRKLKVLAFDGTKVHDFLYHVALAEVWWQDLTTNPQNPPSSLVQAHRARDQASRLYTEFLAACHQGPKQATAFLAKQHELQKRYLLASQPILQAQQLAAARNSAKWSEVAFGTQVVKSTATVAFGIIGLCLVGPEAVVGAGIGLGFDVTMEFVKNLGSANQPQADTVVVGFQQTVANDVVGVAGSVNAVALDASKQAMMQTLAYPLKSSSYRSVASTASQLDGLMKVLGVLQVGVTLYTEGADTYGSFEQMRRAQEGVAQLQNTSPPRGR
jgi:hypothetical protein